MKELRVQHFESSLAEKWDSFVMKDSFNGTFLQTRNFLGYHPEDRFTDASLIIWRGSSDILAVVPACTFDNDGSKVFSSHPGSTFGGLVINERFYNLSNVEALLESLERYLVEEGYGSAILKQSSQIFCSKSNDLLEYFLFQRGWEDYKEISFVIDLCESPSDITVGFTSSRRRDYRYGVKSGLEFRKLDGQEEIKEFYRILSENLGKFDAKPTHSIQELVELKQDRLNDIVDFYGAFLDRRMVSGSMVFRFGDKVFHTQYLAASQSDLNVFPNNFMDANLIMTARDEGYRWFSFGISTEDRGRTLNRNLAGFKEGFGTSYCNNKVFEKRLQ